MICIRGVETNIVPASVNCCIYGVYNPCNCKWFTLTCQCFIHLHLHCQWTPNNDGSKNIWTPNNDGSKNTWTSNNNGSKNMFLYVKVLGAKIDKTNAWWKSFKRGMSCLDPIFLVFSCLLMCFPRCWSFVRFWGFYTSCFGVCVVFFCSFLFLCAILLLLVIFLCASY
jgi:hypothetical protein